MANEAEVDVVVNAANALPDLERQLDRILQTAEDGAPSIDVQASLAAQNTLAVLSTQLDGVLANIDQDDPTIDVDAALNTREALRTLRQDLNELTRSAANGVVDIVDLHATLDFPESLAEVRRGVDALTDYAERTAEIIELEAEVDPDIERQVRRLTSGFGDLGNRAKGALGPIGGLVGTVAKLGATVGTAAPALASAVAAIQQLGPAAGVAVSGMVTMKLAAGTLKLAMVGVSDAVSAAFDPETKPEELAEAMEKLAPNARKFVNELRDMRGDLVGLQQDVQNDVFEGLDRTLRTLARESFPDVANAIRGTGVSLNEMAKNAAAGALALDANGALGKALKGSTQALQTLEQVPNDLVVGLGSIAAAGAPALNRLAAAAAGASDRISDKLVSAFRSGALEDAISGAIDSFAQLGSSVGNILAGLKNVISGLTVDGAGLFGTLEKITQAFEDATATKGFQDAISALSQTMALLVDTALPLLMSALQLLGPIFEALAGPVQTLIEALGAALTPIIAALGPVLTAVADTIGNLVLVFVPFLEVIGQLITTLLPALLPLFDALFVIFSQIAPAVQLFAEMLGQFLTPILEALGPLLDLVLDPLVELYSAVFPAIIEVLLALQPGLLALSLALVEVLEAAGPLIQAVLQLVVALGSALAPVLAPLAKLLLGLVNGALKVVAAFLTSVLVPAIEILTKLLQGRFSDAWNQIKSIIKTVATAVVGFVINMTDQVIQAVSRLLDRVLKFATDLAVGFVRQILKLVNDSVKFITGLPDKIINAVKGFGTLLLNAGKDIIRGLINGLKSMLGSLLSTIGDIGSQAANGIKDFFGISSPSKLTASYGRDIVRGLIVGMNDMVPALEREVAGIAGVVTPSGNLAFGMTGAAGLSVTPAGLGGGQPTNIYLGNEFLARYVDGRVTMIDNRNRRTLAQGVRL
ncbi:hypothetical protein ABZ621_36495 [Streptomyces sp. NPDC007863]|uniref:phage tail protein n=1 Tax=Streptomyces sp. NPDC007863 TaxID=3154894 RepID=UPI0033DA7DD0